MRLNRTRFQWLGTMVFAFAIFPIGLILTGCDRPSVAQPPPGIPEVSTITVATQFVELTTELPGRTSPYRVAEVRPQVNGLIQKRLFTEGSDIKAGQVLFQIDSAPFQAVLDNAMAALEKAQAHLFSVQLRAKRYKDLIDDKAVSRQDYDDAVAAEKQDRADIAACQAMVKTARINLDYTKVTAPIPGRIGKSNVTEGATVTAYQSLPLATIQQLDPIYVDVTQSTTELLRLKKSLTDGPLRHGGTNRDMVGLVLEDGTVYSHQGALQFRDVTVDPTTGSVILRMVFPNPENVLLPGMFVRAVVHEGILEQAILIPQQGVSRDPKGNPFAMIVDPEGKVQQRMLTLSRAVKDQWLVISGLSVGENVIIDGLQRARPGATVRAVPYSETTTAAPHGHEMPSRIGREGGA
ncbi:MAG: efflux RND transporter periplasmic adaptor subunit [Syntrophobacter sp.]